MSTTWDEPISLHLNIIIKFCKLSWKYAEKELRYCLIRYHNFMYSFPSPNPSILVTRSKCPEQNQPLLNPQPSRISVDFVKRFLFSLYYI